MAKRIVCPNCNSKNVKHREDRSKPVVSALGTGGLMYKKMYVCGDCSHKWEP